VIDEGARIPIIRLWHLLLVPLQGQVTDDMADVLSRSVLDTIHRSEVSGLVIDVTGLWLMDSHLCSLISKLALAAKLMGTETTICGMSPEIAITLQAMGLEIGDVRTALTLEEALAGMGIVQVKTKQSDDELDDEENFQ
jgi:rsbT antagonist protein RsbS